MTYHYVRTMRTIAGGDPDRVVVATPRHTLTAAQLVERSARIAGALHRGGVRQGTPIALMMVNRSEVIESFFAGLVLGAPPTNVNPRYVAHEVLHVLEDCQAAAIIHEPAYAEVVREAVASSGRDILMLEVGSSAWAAALTGDVAPERELSDDDRLLIYTGGTTGLPRAVEWLISDHYQMIWQMVKRDVPPPLPAETLASSRRAPTALPCSPILHGVGLSLMLNTLNGGGCVVLTESSSFDAAEVFGLVATYDVAVLGIVGDAFARPLLTELETGNWAGKIPSLKAISSAGAAWSNTVRDRMAELLPGVRLISNFGSTEALVARDMSNGVPFKPDRDMIIIGADGRPVDEGEVGILATTGHLPIGYLGDPEKTAQVFREIDGRRYVVTGDEARREAEGFITLLGRGTSVINTGGEKVWPEEVEGALRRLSEVRDVVVVGRADPTWGQRVTAVLELAPGADVSDKDLATVCRETLAAYKCPKDWVRVESIPRTTVGKPDFPAIQALLGESE